MHMKTLQTATWLRPRALRLRADAGHNMRWDGETDLKARFSLRGLERELALRTDDRLPNPVLLTDT